MSRKILTVIFRIFIGVILILVGIAGMILPFLHGLSFLIAGLIILSFDMPPLERRLEHYSKKHHRVDKLYSALRKVLRQKFNIN